MIEHVTFCCASTQVTMNVFHKSEEKMNNMKAWEAELIKLKIGLLVWILNQLFERSLPKQGNKSEPIKAYESSTNRTKLLLVDITNLNIKIKFKDVLIAISDEHMINLHQPT